MEEKFICSCCGREVSVEEITYVNDDILCPSCVDDNCVTCNCCGDLILNEDDFGDDFTSLCQACYSTYYYRCHECNDLIHESNVYWMGDECYCEDCYNENLEDEYIEDYSYKPEPIFYGEGDRYFGVELEVDKGGHYDEYARRLLDVANFSYKHIYVKNDSSLDDGFEIVSHPMTLDYHLNNMDWEGIMENAKIYGYRSHDTFTCGLHIHVNRSALGEDVDHQEDTISKIMYFIELHWNEMLKFSRRTESNMARWSSRLGYEKTSKEVLNKAKDGSHGRYVAVNIRNRSTVEIRMFRGTLNYNTFVATLQMVNKIVDIALSFTDDDINHQSWSDFVASIHEMELIQYLKERNLYINEPVIAEKEV